ALGTMKSPPAGWQSGYAADCKSAYAGSIPTPASMKKDAPPRAGRFFHGGLTCGSGASRDRACPGAPSQINKNVDAVNKNAYSPPSPAQGCEVDEHSCFQAVTRCSRCTVRGRQEADQGKLQRRAVDHSGTQGDPRSARPPDQEAVRHEALNDGDADLIDYPAKLHKEQDGYVVSFRDIPEALTSGASREEALEMAGDALATAMEFYFEDRRPVPMPSKPRKGEVSVELPASVAVKVLLLDEMLKESVTPSKLARKLDTSPQTVTRIVDLHHATKIDTLAQAFKAIGKTLTFSVG